MRKQRLSAFRPDFEIIGSYANYWILENGTLIATQNKNKPEQSITKKYDVAIDVVNISIGAAKKIRAQWSFNVYDFIRAINAVDENNEFEILLKNGWLHVMAKESAPHLGFHDNLNLPN